MTLVFLRARKCFTPCHTFRQFLLLHHRRTMSESADFQAKCKKIGAVVTRTGSDSESTSPIVALLGWNSAQDQHLAKYSEIFEQKGFDTVRIPADPFNTFLRPNSVKKISLKLLDILVEMKSKHDRPFILYSFSMGGFMVYHFINQAISTPGKQHFNSLHVIGCIFDSCPHFPGMQSLKGIQSTIVETIPNPLFKVAMWVGLSVVAPPVFLFNPTLKQLISVAMASPLGCPELFLFCNTDRLVPEKDVQIFINAHKKKGIKLFSKCWEVSGHVQHYKNYPEEYLREVNTFTAYCLKQISTASKL
ncbi:Transmembrane protein 53 [Desmophyllum pertusum]|uniref:Transmembrane protein 53 n=1 Tax=Desmophyllum pertusum TaxID=174260 RepID=A0A9W9ZPH8_9CNID|nr:Transmembrane protein 53 [Desmophyllum pertusum]